MSSTNQTDDNDPQGSLQPPASEPAKPALNERQATPPPSKPGRAADSLEPLLILDDAPGVGSLFRNRPSRSSRQPTVSVEEADDDCSPLIIIEANRQRFF